MVRRSIPDIATRKPVNTIPNPLSQPTPKRQTQDAKLPEVDVKATGGQLPTYDVKGPDVKVGTKTETVEVPTISVTPPDQKK